MTAQAQPVDVPRKPFPWGKILAWAGLALLLFVTLFPFYWMLRTAFTFPTSAFKNTSSLLPVDGTVINFQRVVGLLDVQRAVELGGTGQSIQFFLALRNSIIVSALIVAGQVTFCAMAAYAFARLNFPFRNQIFAIYIAALMVPGIVMTIPNFILVRNLGWINTFAGIIAPTFLM
ncbi:MAG: carbohydrate ABC transporter permease, partial [Anaerolineae bacterium]|nr:carbohydrate ABC transporter permease [Anaerolineae bacterium]